MCTSKAKVTTGTTHVEITPPAVARINGRPVLQPTCNRVPSLDRRNSLKKIPPIFPPPTASLPFTPLATSTTVANGSRAKASLTPPLSPSSKFTTNRGSDPNALNSSSEKVVIPRNTTKTLDRKKSKSFKEGMGNNGLSSYIEPSLSYSSSLLVEAPGSIAAVRREQVALQQAQRKMKIAHYGRSKSAKFESKVVPLHNTKPAEEKKRCSFITPNSGNCYSIFNLQTL